MIERAIPAPGGYAASNALGKHRPDPGNPHQRFQALFYGAKSGSFAIAKKRSMLFSVPFPVLRTLIAWFERTIP